VFCQSEKAGEWERWQVFSGTAGNICFRSWHGRYLSADAKDRVTANVEKPQEWESFTPIAVAGKTDIFYLRAYNGSFLTTDAKGTLAVTKKQQENEQWTVAVVGAATQLPGSKRLTLPKGRVHLKSRFGLYLKAIPDTGKIEVSAQKPDAWETFEVIYKKDNQFSLMSCTGKYLTVTDKGVIACTADIARGWEFWETIHHAGPQFNFKTFHGTFLAAKKALLSSEIYATTYKDNEDGDTIWTVEPAKQQVQT